MILPPSQRSPNQSEQIGLPEGYHCINGKLYYTDANGNLIILANQLISPVAVTRTVDGKSGHGVVFRILIDGSVHEFIADSKIVYTGTMKLFAELADAGINISPSQVKEFKVYIQACMTMPKLAVRLTLPQAGLAENHLVFALGKRVLVGQAEIDANNEYVVRSKSAEGLTVQGKHEGYTENVLKASKAHPQRFAILAALAAPLAQIVGYEGGGCHLYGASGCGKSTLLQLAASVFGSGAEPGDGSQESLIARWSSTANALEALTAQLSGVIFCIDELGAFRANKLNSTLYKVLSGKGQARMTSGLELAKQHKASVFMLSSGELSVEDKLRQNRESINGGIPARLPSMLMESSHMALKDETMLETAQRMESLKEALCKNGGHIGSLFIQGLLDSTDTRSELESNIREQWDELVEQLTEYASNSIQRRVIRRFGLVLLAGILAKEMGLLPWSDEEIQDAVIFMIERWLSNVETSKSDVERAVDRFTDYLRRNYHSLPYSDDPKIKGAVEGYRHNEEYLLLLPETFRKLCGDVTPTQVGDELKKLGALKHDSNKQQYRVVLPCTGIRQYFYAVRREFIDELLESERPNYQLDDDSDSTDIVGDMLDDDEPEEMDL
jgi:putative DNA primase/helicase